MNTVRSITSVLLSDHAYLRYLMRLVVDESFSTVQRRKLFLVFSAALKGHLEAEDEAIYSRMSFMDADLIKMAFFGEEDHRSLEATRCKLEENIHGETWSADVGEFLDHVARHLSCEEQEMFPLIQLKYPLARQLGMIEHYTRETRRNSEADLRLSRIPDLGEISSELPSVEAFLEICLENLRPAKRAFFETMFEN